MPRPARIVTGSSRPRAPALSPEEQEDRMIGLANTLAEKQLREGTASSQTINYFLERGSTKAKLELEKIKSENELLKRKAESLQSLKNIEELYSEAIKAMHVYGGNGGGEENEASDL